MLIVIKIFIKGYRLRLSLLSNHFVVVYHSYTYECWFAAERIALATTFSCKPTFVFVIKIQQ